MEPKRPGRKPVVQCLCLSNLRITNKYYNFSSQVLANTRRTLVRAFELHKPASVFFRIVNPTRRLTKAGRILAMAPKGEPPNEPANSFLNSDLTGSGEWAGWPRGPRKRLPDSIPYPLSTAIPPNYSAILYESAAILAAVRVGRAGEPHKFDNTTAPQALKRKDLRGSIDLFKTYSKLGQKILIRPKSPQKHAFERTKRTYL